MLLLLVIYLTAQLLCQQAFSLLEIRFQRPWFESCFQQRKTTCLLSIRKSLAFARASKLTTNMYAYMYVRTYVLLKNMYCGLESKSSKVFIKHYISLQERVPNAWWSERIHIMFQQLIHYRLSWGGAIKHWSFVILSFFSNFRYAICPVWVEQPGASLTNME